MIYYVLIIRRITFNKFISNLDGPWYTFCKDIKISQCSNVVLWI